MKGVLYVAEPGGRVRPARAREWAEWFARTADKPFGEGGQLLAASDAGEVRVVTVFAGRDDGSGGGGGPLPFETRVSGGAHDGHVRRYGSEEAARVGHALVTRMVAARPDG